MITLTPTMPAPPEGRIDTQVLEKAVAGVYRQEELRTLSPAQMQRYFLRGVTVGALKG